MIKLKNMIKAKDLIKPILLLPVMLLSVFAASAFAATPTMRLDYYHTGNATQELFSLDRVVIEPLSWPGDPRKGVDSTNLGKYIFEVIDPQTSSIIYSRGFASVYGEWETTDEAKSMNRTFHESLRFPAPDRAVKIVFEKARREERFSRGLDHDH